MIRYSCLIFLFTSILSFGQTHEHWFGMKGGVNFCFSKTNIQPDFIHDWVSNPARGRNSQAFGIGYTYLRNKSLVLNADLIYLQKGGYLDRIILSPDTEVDMSFSSQHITLPLKVGVNVGHKFYAQFLFGISPSVLLYSRFEYQLDQTNYKLKPYVHSVFDLGMNAEARTGYCFSNQLRLFLSITYDHSFFKHNFYVNIPDPVKQMPAEIRYEYASLMIGLTYNIKGDWKVLKPKKKRSDKEELYLDEE